MGRIGRLFQLAAGAVLVIMSIAMMTGYLSTFAYRLLDVFPALANIGQV